MSAIYRRIVALPASPELEFVKSIPGMGPILAAVVVSEVDDISRFASAQRFCGYAGLKGVRN
jgi:transposase